MDFDKAKSSRAVYRALINVIDCLKKPKEVETFLNLSSYFDNVDHKLLKKKKRKYGFAEAPLIS